MAPAGGTVALVGDMQTDAPSLMAALAADHLLRHGVDCRWVSALDLPLLTAKRLVAALLDAATDAVGAPPSLTFIGGSYGELLDAFLAQARGRQLGVVADALTFRQPPQVSHLRRLDGTAREAGATLVLPTGGEVPWGKVLPADRIVPLGGFSREEVREAMEGLAITATMSDEAVAAWLGRLFPSGVVRVVPMRVYAELQALAAREGA